MKEGRKTNREEQMRKEKVEIKKNKIMKAEKSKRMDDIKRKCRGGGQKREKRRQKEMTARETEK